MLFPSLTFLFVFLPVTLAGTFWLARRAPEMVVPWLAMASLAFYGAWNQRFTALLLGSVGFNYLGGLWLARNRGCARQRLRLGLLVAANLLVLGYFKYANFFMSALASAGGFAARPLGIVLPLGISFFTFTQIAFLVDAYRGTAREYRFAHYLLFVTYFPHLIAGPLLHHAQLMPQLARKSGFRFDANNFAAGLSIFVLGLAKKVLVADAISDFATPVFNAARDGISLRLFEAWMGALSYALQLYFDFSGYSDMAIGLALMCNVRLPLNFDSPYKAASVIEFWRRWHMTLSQFLRDYLYFALGGNRHGKARRYLYLMITMLLGGLWHGAAWTFVAWGGFHGLLLCINHGWRNLRGRLGWAGRGRLAHAAAVTSTFTAVVVGWVLFRADSFAAALSLWTGMFGGHGISLPVEAEDLLGRRAPWMRFDSLVFEGLAPVTGTDGRAAIVSIATALAIVWFLPNVRQLFALWRPTWEDLVPNANAPADDKPRLLLFRPTVRTAAAFGSLFLVCVVYIARGNRVTEFLYFQF